MMPQPCDYAEMFGWRDAITATSALLVKAADCRATPAQRPRNHLHASHSLANDMERGLL
jgi:hypothetical protein